MLLLTGAQINRELKGVAAMKGQGKRGVFLARRPEKRQEDHRKFQPFGPVDGEYPNQVLIVFQPEMRKALEQLGKGKIFSYFTRGEDAGDEKAVARTVNEIVKAADKICAYIKCIDEKKAGNTEFDRAAESTLEAVNALGLPEAEEFMREFLGGYKLTLDEIKE